MFKSFFIFSVKNEESSTYLGRNDFLIVFFFNLCTLKFDFLQFELWFLFKFLCLH